MSKKVCKYYRECHITTYTPECTGTDNHMHPDDILGDFCPFCGRKIQLKEFTEIPFNLKKEEQYD